MNALDKANTLALQFNSTHEHVKLKVVVTTDPLTEWEVRQNVHKFQRGDWFLVASIFAVIRGRSANHGEAIQAGRLLKSMGAETKKVGPHTSYRLDNLVSTSAD